MNPEGDGYSAWDDMGVELETAEFLYALVRAIKPKVVLEAGTGKGYASAFIAGALKENDRGNLVTYEPIPEFAAEARRRLAGLPAIVVDGDSSQYTGTPDLVFLDSGPDYRPAEIKRWLATDAPLVIHDSYRYDLPGGVTIPVPRGLWLRLSR